MRPKEINLVDLLVNILLHWRMFIIWILTGAVLFWGVSFIYFRDTYQEATIENMQSQQNNPPSEEEMQNVNYVIAYEAMYRSRETYLEKSPFMKIDSNYVSKAEATVLIEAETGQKSYNIEKVYEEIIRSGELAAKIAASIGTDAIGIDEMILLEHEDVEREIISKTNNIYEINIVNDELQNVNTFRITVIHNDENQCKDILKAIIEFLKDKQSDMESIFGSHEMIVINQTFGIVSDERVFERQKNILADISAMEKTVIDLKNRLSDRELQYYNLLAGSEEATSAITPVEAYSLRDGVKYILFGVITAVFLYTFILIFIYTLNNKVRITDDFQKLYNIPLLGVVPREEKKQKKCDFIDKWILSLYGHNKMRFSREESMEYIAISIKMSAMKNMLSEVYFMGCKLDGFAFNICERIGQYLGKEDIQTIMLNNILYDAQVLNKLEGVKGAVLAIYAGFMTYNEIAEELELIERQGIKVLGAFVLE